ncbi:hypothetical protein ACWDPV_01700 [Gordonia sp. NPDC003504]
MTLAKSVRISIAVIATVVAIVAGLIGGGSRADATVPAPAAGYGFAQGSSPLYQNGATTNRELDAVARTGATWLRVMVDWSTIERVRGRYDWSVPDRVIGAARRHHLTVLSNVLTTPEWARGGAPLGIYAPPADPATLGAFMKAFIKRYPDVTHHEIWNEPNLPLFWGAQAPNPVQYTAVLRAAYRSIKSVQPGSTVVAAGLSPNAGAPGFVSSMYAAGAGRYFDALAMHPYVFPRGIGAKPNGWSEVQQIRNIMVRHGDSRRKIWLTELGAPTLPAGGASPLGFGVTDMVSQREQANQITSVLAAAARSGYSGPAFIYSVRDAGTSPSNREDHFGALLTFDWKPKYAATVLRR